MDSKKYEEDVWYRFNGSDFCGLEGSFDRDNNTRRSKAEYRNGVLRIYGWYLTGGENRYDWESTGPLQRAIGRKLRGIVGADREHSLCVVENGTLRKNKGTFAYVEYYAVCRQPEPSVVQECSRAIIEVLRG